MDLDKLSSVACRCFFAVAFLLLAGGVLEWILARFGVPLWLGFVPSRMLELAIACLIFVIALLLRQVREDLRKRST